MSVRFVLGAAGSGKTWHCLESIARELDSSVSGPPLIFLVPEQATFQMERALLGRLSRRAYCRARVLSFRRLAYWAFQESGGPSSPPIGDLQRRLLLRLILYRNADRMRVFGHASKRPGFEAEIARLVSEFLRQRITPARLEAAMESMETLPVGEGRASSAYLVEKIRDLALVLTEYEKEIAGHFTNPEETPEFLARTLEQSALLKGTSLWVDGFASFSAQEFHALGVVLRQVSHADICLCLDPAELGLGMGTPARSGAGCQVARPLFGETRRTFERLDTLARSFGIPVQDPLLLFEAGKQGRFAHAPELAHLERQLLAFQPKPWKDAPRSLCLVETSTAQQQAEAVARELIRLHTQCGMRWREMAVLCRSLPAQLPFLQPVLREYQIPHFMDHHRPLEAHPLLTLLRSAMRVVAMQWKTQDVLECLKSGWFAEADPVVDRLENYVLEHGITGRRLWTGSEDWKAWPRRSLDEERDWSNPAEDEKRRQLLDELNAGRRRAVSALEQWEAEWFPDTEAISAVRLARAMADLLRRLDVAPRLSAMEQQARERNQPALAEEHRQVLDRVQRVLTEMAQALGESKVSLEEAVELIETALGGLTIGLIPAGLDEVLVGSVDRSRQPELKAVLVIGLSEGEFPRAHAQDPLLTDPERRILRACECDVAPPSSEQFLTEAYYGYIAFTRAREWLWVCRSKTDENGSATIASPFWKSLQKVFPGAGIAGGGQGASDWAQVAGIPQWLLCWGGAFRPTVPESDEEQSCAALLETATGLPRTRWRELFEASLESLQSAPECEGRVSRTEDKFRRVASLLFRGLVPTRAATLSPELARAMLADGATLRMTLSQLESCAGCPFRHYAGYMLALEERPEYRVDAADLGSLYHAVLRLWVQEALETREDIGQMPDARIAESIARIVALVAPRLKNELLLSTARHAHLLELARDTLTQAALSVAAALRAGVFRPAAVELAFGGGKAGSPPLEFTLPGGMTLRLRGRIDRVDAVPPESPAAPVGLCVIDYKTRSRSLDWTRIYYGLELQLCAYALAVCRASAFAARTPAPVSAAAFYMPIMEDTPSPRHPSDLPAPEQTGLRAPRKLRGFFAESWAERLESVAPGEGATYYHMKRNKNGKARLDQGDVLADTDVQVVLRHIERMLVKTAETVIGGGIAVEPAQLRGSLPCEYCPYCALCRFDDQVDTPRVLGALGRRTAIFQALRGGEEQ
jgi:ATP-dependent helicase/nuclease subunit B